MKDLKRLEIILLVLTFFSVSTFLNFNIGIEVIQWIVYVFFIFYLIEIFRKWNLQSGQSGNIFFNWVLFFYTSIIIISLVRGIFFYSVDYWTYKAGFMNFMALSIPFFTYVYGSPVFLSRVLGTWFKWAPLLILLFFAAGFHLLNFQWAIGPFYMMGIFLPLLPRRWRWAMFAVFILCFLEPDARSQLIKALISLLLAFFLYFDRYFPLRRIKILYSVIVFIPIALLILGVSGVFNVFELDSYIDSAKVSGFQKEDENLLADTRSALYAEVIQSATKNDYLIFGRTLARGNDSELFGYQLSSEVTRNGLIERNSNEMALPSVFTWTGLVGLILYSLLFLSSSYYAIFKSNNKYLPYLGIYLLLYWVYSWVENPIVFNLSNISIGFTIGMCVSSRFRGMTDAVFRGWIHSVFSKKQLVLNRIF